MAQDRSKAEVFGGYQFTRLGGTDGVNTNGWNGSLTGYFSKSFGVTADFSGSYKSVNETIDGTTVKANASLYTYTFGPTVALNPDGKVNPFVHAGFGGAHFGGSGSIGDLSGSGWTNGFVMMFGGGVDAKLAPRVAFRIVQADWAYYRFSGLSESKNVRISTGIVFRF